MSRRRGRNKPSTPEEIAARVAERRANDNEVKRLKDSGVEVNTDPRTGKLLSGYRPDCFHLLLKDRPTERGAVDWLETVIRTASGENAQERRPDFIRASADGAPGQNLSADMIAASEVLTVIEETLRPWEARLLFELLRPDASLLTRWQDVVVRITGATTPQRQGERVCVACESLVWVRENAGRLIRERRERRREAA